MRRVVFAAIATLVTLSMPLVARAATVPSLQGEASGNGPIGPAIKDHAELAGTASASGTITFSLFGPEDPRCEGAAIHSSVVAVKGDGSYASGEFFPSATGTYTYVAHYSGDAENEAVSTACGTPAQLVTVTPATPAIATVSSGSSPLGGGIFDTARLLGGFEPTGTVTFRLFGPGDTSCTVPLASFDVPLVEAPRVKSPVYTTLAEGQYRWIAGYSGDARNQATSGNCGEEGESDTVLGAQRGLTLHVQTQATANEGVALVATATIAGTGGAGGTLTFRAYGPSDPHCQLGATAASTQTVTGDGTYSSTPIDPPASGTYSFIASYLGGNGSTVETACGEPGSVSRVTEPPAPMLDKSITVSRVSGTVLVQLHAAASGSGAASSSIGFIEVRTSRRVPVGSTIDTSSGTARLTAAALHRRRQSGVFGGSRFVVRQRSSENGLVEVDLRNAVSRRVCLSVATHARVSRRAKLPAKLLARLRAEVKGQFRTDGHYSSASAHGTSWLTLDRCDGTLTKVLSDVVNVFDFHRRRTIAVRAGHSYLARAD